MSNKIKADDFYQANHKQWKENRDCVEGQRAIHAAGQEYLKAPEGMKGCDKESTESYVAFKNRTLFMNATARTVEGMVGLLFRKKPIYELPDYFEHKNIDQQGNSLSTLLEKATKNAIISCRVGVLVEAADTQGLELTKKQAKELGIRPYVVLYNAEEIIRAKSTTVNGQEVYSKVVILNKITVEDPDDEFNDIIETRYLVLDLVELDGKVVYRQRILDKERNQISEVFPTSNGENMSYIPFEMIQTSETGKSLIEDLVKANLNHYNMNASYTHGVYYTGFPTVWIKGVTKEEYESINGIGPDTLWYSEDEKAEFGMLEFTGQGLGAAKTYLDGIIEIMAVLGADMLKTQKMVAESAESKRLDKQASDSTLISVAYEVERAFERVMGFYFDMSIEDFNDKDSLSIDINKDFNPGNMEPALIEKLLSLYLQSAISYETLFTNLQKGEIIKEDKTAQDELEEIESNG